MKFISNKLLFALFSIGVFGSGALHGADMKGPYYGTERTVTIEDLNRYATEFFTITQGRPNHPSYLSFIDPLAQKISSIVAITRDTDLDTVLSTILDSEESRHLAVIRAGIAAKKAIFNQLENLANNEAASHAIREAARKRAAEMRDESERAEKEQEQSRQQAHARAKKEATQLFAQAKSLENELSNFCRTAEPHMSSGLKNPNFYWEASNLMCTLNNTIIEVEHERKVPATLRVALNDSTRAFNQLKQDFALAQQQQQQVHKRWKRAGDRVRATTRFQAGGKRVENARLANLARLEAQRLAREAQQREEALRLEEEARLEAQHLAREAQRREEQRLEEEARLEAFAKQQAEQEARAAREQARRDREAEETRKQALLDAEEQELTGKLARNRAGVGNMMDQRLSKKKAQSEFSNKVVQPALRKTLGPVKQQDEKKAAGPSQARDVSDADARWGGPGAHQTNATVGHAFQEELSNKRAELQKSDRSQIPRVANILTQLQAIENLPQNQFAFADMNNIGRNLATNVENLSDDGWELLKTNMQFNNTGIVRLQAAINANKIKSQALLTIVTRLNR